MSPRRNRGSVSLCTLRHIIGRIVNVPETVMAVKPAQCGLCTGTALLMCHELSPGNNRHDQGKRAQPRGFGSCLFTQNRAEPLFRDTVRKAVLTDITTRWQTSGGTTLESHQKEKKKQLAKQGKGHDHVSCPGYRAWPLQEFDLDVNKAALIVSGGIFGMNCALSQQTRDTLSIWWKRKGAQGMARKIHSWKASMSSISARPHAKCTSTPWSMSTMMLQCRCRLCWQFCDYRKVK